MAKLSAFADEVTEDFRAQVEYLASETVGFIEPRFINRKNIMDLSRSELDEARKLIRDHGLKVSAIGSPIGKVRLDEPFGPHLDKFKHAVELAVFFETPFIRMFSYYAPEGKNIDDYRDQVIERMAAKVDVVKDVDVTMVHENEAHIYGHTAEHCDCQQRRGLLARDAAVRCARPYQGLEARLQGHRQYPGRGGRADQGATGRAVGDGIRWVSDDGAASEGGRAVRRLDGSGTVLQGHRGRQDVGRRGRLAV
jgi:hypothetical protein